MKNLKNMFYASIITSIVIVSIYEINNKKSPGNNLPNNNSVIQLHVSEKSEKDDLSAKYEIEISQLKETIRYLSEINNNHLANRNTAPESDVEIKKAPVFESDLHASEISLQANNLEVSESFDKIPNPEYIEVIQGIDEPDELSPEELNTLLSENPIRSYDSEKYSKEDSEHRDKYIFTKKYSGINSERDKLFMKAKSENWNDRKTSVSLREINLKATDSKAEYGDDEYDRTLSQSGLPNRLVVSAVLENSPAYFSGIITGDVLISYGGKRIFDWTNFRDDHIEVNEHNEVLVEILRSDEKKLLLLPVGPIGASFVHMLYKPN